jgi:3-dehydroquinate synthase
MFEPAMDRLHVDLGPRSYPIYLGNQILSSVGPIARDQNLPLTIVIITDRTVGKLYLIHVENSLKHHGFLSQAVVLPPGEHQKSLRTANRIFTELIKNRVGRSAAIVALGGGVIGDLAGFVAATYLRGLPLVQIPTTLLAQADSSVGGKVAVNHPLGKNMIGAFYQPKCVISDVDVLRTLPPREVVCGMGEVIKFSVLGDSRLFQFIVDHLDDLLLLKPEALTTVIARCCEIKASLVSRDEVEKGERIVLNYGHTVGHAIEAAGGYRMYKHGEAVLIGMWVENTIARRRGVVSEETVEPAQRLLRRLLTMLPSYKIPIERVLSAMAVDKKSVAGKLRMVLPRAIGEVGIVEGISREEVLSAVQELPKNIF